MSWGTAIIICRCIGDPTPPIDVKYLNLEIGITHYADSFWEVHVYAIVECGGRQYRAEEGHSFSVEKLPYEVGEQIELERVLLLADGEDISVGAPTVGSTSVKATVIEQYRAKKIFVWKYKSKSRYRRRQGHRQYYTRLHIDEIVTA
jgi:large subunit ribosomal protein L21